MRQRRKVKPLIRLHYHLTARETQLDPPHNQVKHLLPAIHIKIVLWRAKNRQRLISFGFEIGRPPKGVAEDYIDPFSDSHCCRILLNQVRRRQMSLDERRLRRPATDSLQTQSPGPGK